MKAKRRGNSKSKARGSKATLKPRARKSNGSKYLTGGRVF